MKINTEIFAHRGSSGDFPENTMPAFRDAIDSGCDGIETDVQLSKDGRFIIMHDEKVNRTTNGKGYIQNLTLEQIKGLDAGIKKSTQFRDVTVPTLEELVDLLVASDFQGKLNLELKTNKIPYPGIEKQVFDYLNSRTDIKFEIIYSSFSDRSVQLLHKLDAHRIAAKLFKKNFSSAIALHKERVIEDIHPEIGWLKKHIGEFQVNHVRPWLVNTPADMEFCFKSGVAGFFTDYPRRAMKLKREMENGADA